MINGINHIGLAVASIDEALAVLVSVFGARELGRKAFPELGKVSCMVRVGDGLFELMEPIGETGVVPKFLREHGQGLHHVSLLADDLNAVCAALREQGLRVLGSPQDGTVFTHPKETSSVIYEITDTPFQGS
jgi:methylmalonyl-CoA/ethylmalonyl-CoA epimerase